MPSPKRRAPRFRGLLSQEERTLLLTGTGLGFHDRVRGTWTLDEDAAREAWEEHGVALTAEWQARGYTAWGAVAFDGAIGDVTPYDRLVVEP